MSKIIKKAKKYIGNLKYSDMEPIILNACIMFYLFYEYVGNNIIWLQDKNLLPILGVAILKLALNKLDKFPDKSNDNVGYLNDIIDQCMKKTIHCDVLRIFSYDSKGFYHAILGKEFFAEEIIVLMHKDAYTENDEILHRWDSLVDRKKANKVTIKLHGFNRIVFGMTFDTKIGVFGCFKPKCVADQGGISSTKNTYCCSSKESEASRQVILDFNDIFDEMNRVSTLLHMK